MLKTIEIITKDKKYVFSYDSLEIVVKIKENGESQIRSSSCTKYYLFKALTQPGLRKYSLFLGLIRLHNGYRN